MWATVVKLNLRYAARYARRNRRKFHRGIPLPMRQETAQLDESVDRIIAATHRDPKDGERSRLYKEALLSRGEKLLRERSLANKLTALEGLGDMEPLSMRADFGISETDRLKYESSYDMQRHVEPPMGYNRGLAHRLAEGTLWPHAPLVTEGSVQELTSLRDFDSMSPSARKFATQVEYHLRRQMKACPAHIAENIDFSQLTVQEVLASQRCRVLYIVWSTIHPGARFEIEPHLQKLTRWIRFVITTRLRHTPAIPTIRWVYHQGTIARQLSKEVRRDMQRTYTNIAATTDVRLKYLRNLDTLNKRLEGVPWFLPYIWAKEHRASQKSAAMTDYEEYVKEQGEKATDSGKAARSPSAEALRPRYVS